MRDKLYKHLLSRPEEGGTAGLLELIFPGSASPSEFGKEFLRGLLSDDPRFLEDSATGEWRLVDDHLFAVDISEVPFVVVDLEGTGNSPGRGGITEIGAVRLENGRIVDTFETFVNPERRIPSYVAKMTGITDEMVTDAPTISGVIGDFLAFAEGSVLVAHNASFDIISLDIACQRHFGRPLGIPWLCTVEMARRAWPHLQKTSLDALAEHFDLHAHTRHRALADAELTAQVLERLFDKVRERGATTIAEVTSFLEGDEPRRSLEIHVSQDVLERLPESPGSYRLIDGNGSTLLVSRASNLREAVLPYFLGSAHLSDRQVGMVAGVHDVRFVATGSELEAALVEANDVRRHEPSFNRGNRHLPRLHFLRFTVSDEFPAVYVSPRLRADDALYLGPLGNGALADEAARAFSRRFRLRTCPGLLVPAPGFEACSLGRDGWCSSPCDQTVSSAEYAEQARQLQGALGSADVDFEKLLSTDDGSCDSPDRRVTRVAGRLARLHDRQSLLWHRQHYIAVLPGRPGNKHVFAVVRGRLYRDFELERPEQVDELVELLAQALTDRRHERMNGRVAVESSIMANWLSRNPGLDVAPTEGMLLNLDADGDQASLRAAAGALRAVVSR